MKITDESNRIASFRDLENFVEAQAKVSNSVFGLKFSFLAQINLIIPRSQIFQHSVLL